MKRYLVVYLDVTNEPEWKVVETDEEKLSETMDNVGPVINWNGNNEDLYIVERKEDTYAKEIFCSGSKKV